MAFITVTRTVQSILFILIALLLQQIFQRNSVTVGPWVQALAESGVVELKEGTFSLYKKFYGIGPLDELWRIVVVAFTASTFELDPISWWQMFSFLADAAVVYAVWVLEGCRVGNRRTLAY